MATDAPSTSLLRPLVEDLAARRQRIREGGGAGRIEKQHAAEKLTARERLELLIDEGTFVELGIHGRPHFSQRAMDGKEAPADGVVTGYGKVDGRLSAVAAYDFTVMAGSMGMTGEAQDGTPTRPRADSANPDDLAARLSGGAYSGSSGLAVRGHRPPLQRGGRHERRSPAGGGSDGPVRRGNGHISQVWRTSCLWSAAEGRWRSPVHTWCGRQSERT